MSEDKLPLDEYDSKEAVDAAWQETQKGKEQRKRVKALTESQRLVGIEFDPMSARHVDYNIPTIEELQEKVAAWPLWKARERLAEIDSEIQRYRDYEPRVRAKLEHDAKTTHGAYGISVDDRLEELLNRASDEWPAKFQTVKDAIAYLEEIKDVYQTRVTQLQRQATPEHMKRLLAAMTQDHRKARKIVEDLEKAIATRNHKKAAVLASQYIELRQLFSESAQAWELVNMDRSITVPDFPTTRQLPPEVQRIIDGTRK